ncbi:MAG: alanine racemase [Microbacteriaceae bacterium]|nr:alanine racemase [Microbacteriaceae bacterium]
MRAFREARVDLGAIIANVDTLRAAIGTTHTMAVVKARGYGHGAVPSARAAIAGGADWLGVVEVAEALELRAAKIDVPILAWLHDPAANFDEAVSAQIDIGINSLAQLDRAAQASGTAVVHLKVDTGLGRNGVVLDECEQLFAAAHQHEKLGRVRVRGIFSHLANASDADDAAQATAFESAVALAESAGLAPELRHLASTAAALRLPATRFDLVRLGIGIYGLSPFDDQNSESLGLRPALELSAVIVSVKRVPAGSGVSYGYTYRTAAPTTLALVPLGYADGIPRQASNRAPVSINGKTYPIAGRVAMDQFVVDVGDAVVAEGDRAVLFGDPARGIPSADDWARSCDTINYEIVTRLAGRLGYRYLP